MFKCAILNGTRKKEYKTLKLVYKKPRDKKPKDQPQQAPEIVAMGGPEDLERGCGQVPPPMENNSKKIQREINISRRKMNTKLS